MSFRTRPVRDLKASIRARLLADAGVAAALAGAVFDAPPQGASPPYLHMPAALARDNGTGEGGGAEIRLELGIVTSERGTLQALAIAGLVEAALETPLAPLPEDRLVALETREVAVRHDPVTSLTRATLRLSAFTEPF